MGDPLTVPEDPSLGADIASYGRVLEYPEPEPEPDCEPGREPVWLRLPLHLEPYFQIGFVHSDEICPLVVMRVRDEADQTKRVEVSAPPEEFMQIVGVIMALCQHVPCIAHRATSGQVRRQAG